MRTVSYKETLQKRLADPEYAAGYLNESLEEGTEAFLLALRDVIEAPPPKENDTQLSDES